MSYIAGASHRSQRQGAGIAAGALARELVVPTAFILAILASNFALASQPNVKLFDLMVFVAGFTLGFRRGMVVAAGAWLVYGTFNPWGAAGPLLLATMMMSEAVYALAGAGLGRLVSPQRLSILPGRWSLLFAAAALVSTLAYDALTNVYTGIVWAQVAGAFEYKRWILIALFNPGALLFSAVHVGSNVLFFAVAWAHAGQGRRQGQEGASLGTMMHRRFAYAALLAMALAPVLIGGCGGLQVEVGEATPTATPLPTIQVSLLIHFSESDVRWFRDVEARNGANAYELTEQVTEGELESTYYASFFAHFVEEIMGVANEGSTYWAIFLWNASQSQWEPLPVGADLFSLKDGHVLAWAYTDSSAEPKQTPSVKP